MTDLPAEIMVEILSRLPVKSLCRFRCVSKPWRYLISNTKFTALHAKKALESKEEFLRRRRVVFNVPSRGLYSLNLDEYLNHNYDFATATELDFLYQEFRAQKGRHAIQDPEVRPSFASNSIYACNNLLLLLINWSRLNLVNPATREMKKLPEMPQWRPNHWLYTMRLCGFGFDYSNNEYKVVNGQIYPEIKVVIFSVYTLKADSWRQIEYDYPYRPDSYYGIFLNGAIHWLASRVDQDGHGFSLLGLVILSFRLAEEDVCEIQLPPTADIARVAHLGVFRNCLCITMHSTDQIVFEFWVMEQDTSWTKFRFSTPYDPFLYTSLIGFSTESHDLMVCGYSLVMYNFKEDSYRSIPIRDIPMVGGWVGIYVEGFFPLIDQGQEDEQRDQRHREDERVFCTWPIQYI